MIFSYTQLEPYFKGEKCYKTKVEAVINYNKLKLHADGEFPEELIGSRRPNEPADIQAYRKAIYSPKSKHALDKVITSLSKVRRSQDWKTKWDVVLNPAFISDAMKLQTYIDEDYPVYESFDNWLFDEFLGQICIDSNCVVCTIPFKMDLQPDQLEQPMMQIYNSPDILEHIDSEITIVKSSLKVTIDKAEKDVFIVFDDEAITFWVETNSLESRYTSFIRYPHGHGDSGCFRPKALYDKTIRGEILWKSPLQPMVPHLDEVAREYNDLQAEKVVHIFSEKWEINTNECKKCQGIGTVPKAGFGAGDRKQACTACEGTGREISSPFKSKQYNIDLRKLDSKFPLPPAGYLQKDTSITKILDEAVDKHIYQALDSVNMQFLAETHLAQSGKAKEWDRDETSNFAFKVASILVYTKKLSLFYINEYRYSFMVPSYEARQKMMPLIVIPKKFDIITVGALITQHQSAKEAKLSPVLIMAMETEIAEKMYSDDPDVSLNTRLTFELDPMPGLAEDEKTSRLMNNGILESTYVISSNIGQFVKRARKEFSDFAMWDYGKQMDQMDKYAQEVITANGAKAKQLDKFNLVPPVPPIPVPVPAH